MIRKNSRSGNIGRNEIDFVKIGIILLVSILVCSLVTFTSYKIIQKLFFSENSVSKLYEAWNNNEIEKVYKISSNILAKNHLHNTALTFRGYSAFKLAVSEPDNSPLTLFYIERAINDLRVAKQSAKKKTLPQIYYVLGLTYFYKNKLSTYHYYADLSIKYLEQSFTEGYKSKDIPELLGLNYADLGNSKKSIECFGEALLIHESDTLLYNIAIQYYNSGQKEIAKQYIVRTIELSNDDDILSDSHSLMARIYTEEENYSAARRELDSILEKNENYADAHYGLGVLYEKQGDLAKARSEWRKCLKLQVNHSGALKKLAELK